MRVWVLPAGSAAQWLCKVSGVHSVQGCCHPHFRSWSIALQTYLPVLWSRPLFCLYKRKIIIIISTIIKTFQWLQTVVHTLTPAASDSQKGEHDLDNTGVENRETSLINSLILPVIWNWVLGRGPCQATHPRCAWGFWVGVVGLGTRLAPGFGIKTGQEGRFGWLSTCRALGCKEPKK